MTPSLGVHLTHLTCELLRQACCPTPGKLVAGQHRRHKCVPVANKQLSCNVPSAEACAWPAPPTHPVRERKLNTIFFFSNFSGTPGIPRQNPGISRQKSLISLVSRGIPNFLAPTPSRGRPLPHRKISGLKSLGLGSFFVPDLLRISIPSSGPWSQAFFRG